MLDSVPGFSSQPQDLPSVRLLESVLFDLSPSLQVWPLSVCFLNDSPSSPPLSFSPSPFPPSSLSPPVCPPPLPYPSASVCSSWPRLPARPLDLSRVGAPFLPQVSVCSPRAVWVSGGLWGRRSPLQLRLQQSPSPQEACLENIPAQEGLRRARPAPRTGARHNDGPAHTQIHTRGPSTQTRACTHSPAHPKPREQNQDRRRANPGPATAGASAQTATGARPRTHSPCHPQTSKHAPCTRQGPPGAAPAPSAQAASPGRTRGSALRRSLRTSTLLSSGAAAAGWARPAAARRCLVTGTPGAEGGGPARTSALHLPSRCPAPARLQESPAHPRPRPLRRSLALMTGAPPLLRRPRPSLAPPPALEARWTTFAVRRLPDSLVRATQIPPLFLGISRVPPKTWAPPPQSRAFALGRRPLSPY